jgi:hypothetical protein
MKSIRTSLSALAGLLVILVVSACQSTQPLVNVELESQDIVQPNIYAKGFVWLDQASRPVGEEYTPNRDYQFNQRFDYVGTPPTRVFYPAADNTVTRLGAGRYLVRFPNFNVRDGVVHVTAYGGNHHCKVEKWRPVGVSVRELQVFVRCRNAANVLADGQFNVLFYKNGAMSDLYGHSYLLSDNPTTSFETPVNQYNSRAGSSSVRRLPLAGGGFENGLYEVTLPGMALSSVKGGTVLVTAYGTSAAKCKVEYWVASGSDIKVNVRCFVGSRPSNTRFTLSYFEKPGTLAISVAEDQNEAWYVWANTTPTPSRFYQSNSYGNPRTTTDATKATLTSLSTGRYRVTLPGVKAFNKTTTQLTGYGSDSSYCNTVAWIPSTGATDVTVQCYDASGSPADSKFDLLYYTNQTILF